MSIIHRYSKEIAATIGVFILMLIALKIDGINLDWAALVTLLVTIFGFILKISADLARLSQKLDDHILHSKNRD